MARNRKKAQPMPEGTYASKLRVGPITKGHMAALGQRIQNKRPTRNHMRDYLTQACNKALDGLGAADAPTDLLG